MPCSVKPLIKLRHSDRGLLSAITAWHVSGVDGLGARAKVLRLYPHFQVGNAKYLSHTDTGSSACLGVGESALETSM